MQKRHWITFAAGVMFAAFAGDAQAQGEIGFKLGATIATVSSDVDLDVENLTAFGGGGHVRFALSEGLSLQPEVLFMRKGYGQSVAVPNGGAGSADVEFKVDYVEIPVLVRLDIGGAGAAFSPFVYGGGYGAFQVGCNTSVGDRGDEACAEEQEPESFDFGAVLGGGIGFGVAAGMATLEARYDLGLQNLADEDAGGFDLKNRAFGIFVGYSVPLGR